MGGQVNHCHLEPHTCASSPFGSMTNLKQNKLYPQKNTNLEMMNDKFYKGKCCLVVFLLCFLRRIYVYCRQMHVSSHTDEFSGAVSLSLRKQSLQNRGKELSNPATDCNHLLSGQLRKCWECISKFLENRSTATLTLTEN